MSFSRWRSCRRMTMPAIAETTNDIHYGNDNLAADAYVDPEILSDPAIYPTAEMQKRLYSNLEVSANTERLRTRTWTRLKAGY
jgi:putrescine transport system substrate-binding protein